MEARRPAGWVLTIIVLTCLSLIWALTRVYITPITQQPDLSSPSAVVSEPAISSSDRHAQDAEHLLPPGTTLLERLEADLNNDGEPEIVLAFNDSGDPHKSEMAGIAILVADGDDYQNTWEVRPLSEGKAADVLVRDINLDGVLEVLLYKNTEDGTRHSLHIFAWDHTGYASLGPGLAVRGADEVFTSAFYPPQVRNVDSTAFEEIVVFEDESSSERLKVIVYQWDGEAYAPVDWMIMLGPLRPPEEKR